MVSQRIRNKSLQAVSSIALASLITFPHVAAAQEVTEIVVVAQKKEENLQSVPIAVTAFDAASIDKQQIEDFSDLQFHTPNVSFSRGNFSTNNFQIRGIGSAEIAASGDAGVAFHVDGAYLNAPRLADSEFYDLERIEVLRGPQGTLYGRNSTGGSVNLITKKPDLLDFGGNAELQYGNYNHVRVNGAINLPIVKDQLAFRLSGMFLKRDGYTENVNPTATFDDIDGRELWSIRASARWQPTDTSTLDIMYQHFAEDDNRTRSNKTLCDFDPSAILGCTPQSLEFETTNFDSSFGQIIFSDLVLPAGFLALSSFGAASSGVNPPDLRQVSVDFDPVYKAKEHLLTVQLAQELGDTLNLTALFNYHESNHESKQSFTGSPGLELTVPPGLEALFPTAAETYYTQGCFPKSSSDGDPFNTGIFGGFIEGCSNSILHLDESDQKNKQYGGEVRLASNFDGPFNFLLAGNYLNFDRSEQYTITNNTIDYLAVIGTLLLTGSPVDGVGLVTPYFQINTDKYSLETYAAFGEAYIQATDKLKITLGLRYTKDDKYIRDRQSPVFSIPVDFTTFDPAAAEAAYVAAGFDADPARPGNQLFREASQSDDIVTGRIVVDYNPDLAFTDNTLLYASYSRGYRGGGFNPAFDPISFPSLSPNYGNESVNAFEIGAKNTLFGRSLQANIAAFYYDYGGYQIVTTRNRALINENIDARIFGAEAELIFAASNNLSFDARFSYLNTKITRGTSIDTRDPTNGLANSTLIKSLNFGSLAENCVINWNNGNGDPVPQLTADGVAFASPLGATPGIASGSSAFSPTGCAVNDLQLALDNAFGPGEYTASGGNPVDLVGNELPNAPDWTFSVGAEYKADLSGTTKLVTRVDYYRQSSMWARIYNRPATDRIGGWGMLNAQVTLLVGEDNPWYVRAFVQNILNDDNITGHYLNAPSSGLWTNVFVLEPRRFGVSIGGKF